jgi:hypothetical protein
MDRVDKNQKGRYGLRVRGKKYNGHDVRYDYE